MKKLLAIPLIAIIMMSLLFIPVDAADNSHKISFWFRSGRVQSDEFPDITVNDNGSFTIPNKTPTGFINFNYWTLKRKTDNKWFSTSNTWIPQSQVEDQGEAVLAKFYPGRNLTINSTWFSGTSAAADFEFHANADCELRDYAFSYDTNGGTGSYSTQYVYFQHDINIPPQSPTRSGYNFKGWALKRLSDNRMYVTGIGWKTLSEISQNNYKVKLYPAGLNIMLGLSCIQGETSPKGFAFVAQWEPAGQRVIADGRYHIVSMVDDDLCVSVLGASTAEDVNVVVWRSRNLVEQAWDVKYEGYGFYSFTNVNSGYRMDLDGGRLEAGTNVKQHHDNGEDAQKWCIVLNSDGSYCIQSKVSGMYLDVVNLGTANGTNIGVHSNNATAAQRFYFVKYSGQTLNDGCYKISSVLDTEKVVGVSGDSTESQANVCLSPSASDNSRYWDITYIGGGYYKIINHGSGKSLDVSGMSRDNQANVQQYNYNTAGANSQMWILAPTGEDSTYNIISKCGGRYLDISGENAVDGANIWMLTGSGRTSQKWKFTKWSAAGTVSGGQVDIDLPGGGSSNNDQAGSTTNKTSTGAAANISDGVIYTIGGSKIKVLSTVNGTAAFTKAGNMKTVTVPANVSINGKVFMITQVSAGAFKGKNIRTVIIGKNVKKISKNAFKGSKATKMIVKTKKLKKARVKGSLKGSKIKTAQIKVGKKKINKTYVKKYKKIFTKKNAGRKIRVK